MSADKDRITAASVAKGCALMMGIGWAVIAVVAAVSPSQAEVSRRQSRDRAETAITSMVANCAAQEGPWKCFVKLEAADASDPIKAPTRLQRLARIVPAWEVLAFCTEPRQVDCADRMVGKAYSREDILAGMGN